MIRQSEDPGPDPPTPYPVPLEVTSVLPLSGEPQEAERRWPREGLGEEAGGERWLASTGLCRDGALSRAESRDETDGHFICWEQTRETGMKTGQ